MFRTIIGLSILSVSFSLFAMHTTPVTTTPLEILQFAANGNYDAIEEYIKRKGFISEIERKEIYEWAYKGGHFSIVQMLPPKNLKRNCWSEEDIDTDLHLVSKFKRDLFLGVKYGDLDKIKYARKELNNFYKTYYDGAFDINILINGDGLAAWQVAQNQDYWGLAKILKQPLRKLTKDEREEINNEITKVKIARIYQAAAKDEPSKINIHDFPWHIFLEIRQIEEKKKRKGEKSTLDGTYLSHALSNSEKWNKDVWELATRSILFLQMPTEKYDFTSRTIPHTVSNTSKEKFLKKDNEMVRLLTAEEKSDQIEIEFAKALKSKDVEKIFSFISRNIHNIGERMSTVAAQDGQMELSIFLGDIHLWQIVNKDKLRKVVEEKTSPIIAFWKFLYL